WGVPTPASAALSFAGREGVGRSPRPPPKRAVEGCHMRVAEDPRDFGTRDVELAEKVHGDALSHRVAKFMKRSSTPRELPLKRPPTQVERGRGHVDRILIGNEGGNDRDSHFSEKRVACGYCDRKLTYLHTVPTAEAV